MELYLTRIYYPEGTNGEIFLNNNRLCSSIELPWLDNRHVISCIPEGKYELMIRFTHRLQWHLQVKKVENRDLILIHPANDARKELKGCIAPVSVLEGPGRGAKSRAAFSNLLGVVFPELDKNQPVFLIIKAAKTAGNYKL